MNSKTRFRKTKIILTILYLVILAAYGVFLFLNYQARRAGTEIMFGSSALYEVDGGFGTGALARPQDSYQMGQKVVYKAEDGYAVGRIEQIATSNGVDIVSIIAEGERDHVALTAVMGVVTAQVPVIGGLSSFLKSSYGVVLIVVIPCVLFLVHQVVLLTRTLKSKKEKEDELTDSSEEPDYAPFSRLPSLTPSRGELTDRFATLTKVAKEPPREASSIYKPAQPTPQKTTSAPAAQQDEDDALRELFSEMKYKMAFQDTQQLSPVQEHAVEDVEESGDLEKYGLQTQLIEDGIEVNIDSTVTNEIKLRLKNDGSLSIITDKYQAEINADL